MAIKRAIKRDRRFPAVFSVRLASRGAARCFWRDDLRVVRPYRFSPSALSPASGYKVSVALTLTAPGCGMGPAIAEDARAKILLVPGVTEAEVRITWEPHWDQSMISEEGRMKLGLI